MDTTTHTTFWLRYTYDPTLGGGDDDFVGPFASHDDALAHRRELSPSGVDIIERCERPDAEHTMSPDEHRGYITERT